MAEATQDAAKPARKKNAHYDVYRVLDDGDRQVIAENVAASSRRAAITQATAAGPEEGRYGTFATVRSGEMKVLTRAKKTIVADDWGPA